MVSLAQPERLALSALYYATLAREMLGHSHASPMECTALYAAVTACRTLHGQDICRQFGDAIGSGRAELALECLGASLRPVGDQSFPAAPPRRFTQGANP